MKVLSAKTVKNETIFKVELETKQWKKTVNETKNNITRNIQIPGFRKGHAPQSEIDKRVSQADVAMRALEKLQNEIVKAILDSKEFKNSDCLDSITNMSIVKLEPTPIIDIHMELVPKVLDFDKADISKITVAPFKAPNITDAMVKNQIRMMIRPDAMVSTKKDGKLAKGDIAVIDFKGFIDGKAFAGGQGKNHELEIGSKSFIDDFEDQLIGCKKGDKKDVKVTFPKDYGMKDYAGKPAKFEVEIKDVKEIEYPEITKDYCKKFSMDCANMKELEAHIKDLFKQEAQMRYQDVAMRSINEAISKKAKLNYYPISLINMHKRQIINQYEQEAKRAGYNTLDAYKKALKIDNKLFEDNLENAARMTLNVALTYEKLIEDYKLKITEADTKDYLEKLTRYVGDAKKAKDLYEKNKEMADNNILRDKLFKKLVEEVKQEEPKKAKEDSKKHA